jgi:hypothetical protein
LILELIIMTSELEEWTQTKTRAWCAHTRDIGKKCVAWSGAMMDSN